MAEIHASYESEQQFEDEAVERYLDDIGGIPRRALHLLLNGGLDDIVVSDMAYAEQAVRIWKRVLGAL